MAKTGKTPGLLFIFLTALLDIVGLGLIIPIFPQLVSGFTHGDLSEASRYLGVAFSLYTLMQFTFSPFLGALSDQVGRKPVLLFSLLGTSLSYVLTALAPSIGFLFAARILAGISGASLSVASTYIADVTAPEERAKGYGMIGAAFGLGFIIGPAVGGLLGQYGPQVPVYLAGAVSFLNFLYGFFLVPESHKPENRRPMTWAKANPLSWIGLLKSYPMVASLAVVFVLSGLGQQCLHSTWVVYTSHRFNWTPMQNGLSLTLVGVTAAIVQGALTGKIIGRFGERKALLGGLAVSTLAFTAYALATQGWMLYAILVVGSLGGIAGPAVQAMVSKSVGPDEQGRMQGAMASLMSLTGVFGPLAANALFAYFNAPTAPVQIPGISFFLGAAFLFASLVASVAFFSRKPVAVPQPELVT